MTLTPDFTIQYYGSPFIATGHYYDYILVTDPKGENFDDRFTDIPHEGTTYNENESEYSFDTDGNGITNFVLENPDFHYSQFNSNLVLRWEYVTGSSLFLVWSQNLSQFIPYMGDFNARSDVRDIFRLDAENIFLIKFSYLLNI